ncbi:MAG: outer membrane protein assembly factor BamA [Alphaproteobacteria bacterium]|nr:outer membrane protein assembly factor BamA [Alphaproteobacteria bacterium]
MLAVALPALRVAPVPGVALAQVDAGTVVREIRVEGTERIDPTTVRSYMVVNPGDQFDVAKINQSLKSLYATGLFANVEIRREGQALVVQVEENPVINRIAFEGNNRIKDEEINAEIQLRPRVVYTRSKVQSDVKRIIDLYRRNGRYSATIEPKIIKLDQNRVDLVFEVNEGGKTGVRRLIFVGNKRFSDGRLREVIQTNVSRWWAFWRSGDTYDPDRLAVDRELLRRFYLENGYADFRVLSAVAELTPEREDFVITFTIQEGERYKFGEAGINAALRNLDTTALQKTVLHGRGDWYNADKVEKTVSALTDAVGTLGYAFVDVKPKIDKDEANRVIGISYEIGEGPKVYVERIEVKGNVRTEDRVIRREFRLAEGDAFNTSKLRRSRQRIQNLGFFKKVDVKTVQGSTPERTVVEVEVEEKPTGELSFGVGYSTADGVLGDVAIRERNLLGKGQELRLAFQGSTRTQQIDLGFTEPYFLDRPVSAGADVFRIRQDRQNTSNYDQTELGFRLRSGYAITENMSQQLRYALRRVTVENIGAGASTFITSQAGDSTYSEIGQSLIYDRRDNRFAPTAGYFGRLSNDLAGLGGSVRYLKSRLDGGYYYSIIDGLVLAGVAEVGYIYGLGEDVRLSDRFFLGGTKVRGFRNFGIGPRDVVTSDALGGDRYYTASLELRFPLGLPEELGVSGRAFLDGGSLWNVPASGPSIRDDSSLRAGTGLGIAWNSPFGPISVDYGIPFLKKNYDRTENFRVSFGTSF